MTRTPTHHTDREVTVHTFSVSCPCGSGLATTAHDAGFAATTVQVDRCAECPSPAYVAGYGMRKSWAYANALPTTATVSHRDGLVSFEMTA